jgi:hypothetical protein
MKVTTFWLLSVALALPAQQPPNPITVDQFRDQLNQVNPNPVRDVTDAATRSREALRLPLNGDPSLSLAEIQAAQRNLLRLNDMMNADADRAALANPGPQFVPRLLLDPEQQLTTPGRPLARTPSRTVFPTPYVSAPPAIARPAPPEGHTQNVALVKPTRQSSVRFFGSRAGVDGRITGTPGFYTELESEPWWDVDLEKSLELTELRIYNSKINPERARTLKVLLSKDGVTWNQIYSHNGSVFGADGQPLRIPLHGAQARWIRLQLTEKNHLHLDEVEVY